MFVGHSRFTGITWSVSGTGAAILSAPSNLDDGLPDTVAALRWLSGTQNTGSVLRLRADWADPRMFRAVGLSNILLPVGTKVTVSYRRVGDAAGTYPYVPAALGGGVQRIFEGIHGERTAWILYQARQGPVIGAEFQIANDVNGVASIPASFAFAIGDACMFDGDDVPISKEWSDGWIDPLTEGYSPTRQPYTQPGTLYRQLEVKLPMATQSEVYGVSMAPTAFDYERLLAKINRGQISLYVTRYRNADGSFSPHLLHRTARLGIATKLPRLNHRTGKWWDSESATIIESPIPV